MKHIFELIFQKTYFKIFPQYKLNINVFLDSISDLDYVLIKEEVPYSTNDFPVKYPIGKDLDIITTDKYFEVFTKRIEDFADNYPHFNLVKQHSIDNFKLRFLFFGCLHYQIDLSCSQDYLNKSFIEQSITTRCRKKNYYVPEMKFELVYRLVNYYKNQNKKHHLTYIKANVKYFDENVIDNQQLIDFYHEYSFSNDDEIKREGKNGI